MRLLRIKETEAQTHAWGLGTNRVSLGPRHVSVWLAQTTCTELYRKVLGTNMKEKSFLHFLFYFSLVFIMFVCLFIYLCYLHLIAKRYRSKI